MSDIIYPTLDLFLYDLRNGLGDSQDELNLNRGYFQRKIPESIHPFLFQFDSDFEAEYVELLAKPRNRRFEANDEPYPLEGYYYPVRIADSYGLLLDCSVDNPTKAQRARCFATLKDEIEQRLTRETPTIGQTWMISGQLPEPEAKSSQAIEEIAKECYEELMPDSNWEQDLKGQGQFFGATIFELWQYRLVMKEGMVAPASIERIHENQHVIIILYSDEETARKGAGLYSDWLRLFCYRNRILWAYGQSRLLKQSLKKDFSTIQEGIKSLRQEGSQGLDFQKLQASLEQLQDTLTPYTVNLANLDFQSRTIDINLSNYKKRVDRINKKADPQTDLKFLEEFNDLGTDKYLLQTQKDYDNFQLGLRLLDSSINTVRCRVEINEAQRDRAFQKNMAIGGIGLAAGLAVASISGQFPVVTDTKTERAVEHPVGVFLSIFQIPKAWLAPGISLFFSLAVALIAGLATKTVMGRSQRSQ